MINGDFAPQLKLAVLKLKNSPSHDFKIEDFHIKFKYATVEVGVAILEQVMIFSISETESDKVLSITLDVFGIDTLPTEIEIYKDKIVYFPKRDNQKILNFMALFKNNNKTY